MKYLELKNQIGGMFGVGECSFIKYNQENARKAFINKCNKDTNFKDLKKFQIKDLRVAGFDIDETDKVGFTRSQNGDGRGFSAIELKAAGFSAKDFKNGNDAINLAYPIDAHNIRFSANDLKVAGFSVIELKVAGFSAKELCDYKHKVFTGFSAEELKAGGFSEVQVKERFI